MSGLRPECKNSSKPRTFGDYEATWKVYDAVRKRRSLGFGKLDTEDGKHCAMGCFWDDHPGSVISSKLIDEIAAVNDSVAANSGTQRAPPSRSALARVQARHLMNRLDFMNCPLCSGHEQIGADTAHTLREAIDLYFVPATDLPEHVRGELLNIRNVIQNGREPGRPEPARGEESWLDA